MSAGVSEASGATVGQHARHFLRRAAARNSEERGVGAERAVPVLERVRERLQAALSQATVPSFTVSCGVSDSNRAPRFQEVVAQADEALLRAKRGGRDRIELATGGSRLVAEAYDVEEGLEALVAAETGANGAEAEAASDADAASPANAPARNRKTA